MNSAANTADRIRNAISFWRACKPGTRGQARLIAATIAELKGRLAALG